MVAETETETEADKEDDQHEAIDVIQYNVTSITLFIILKDCCGFETTSKHIKNQYLTDILLNIKNLDGKTLKTFS